MDSIGHWIGQIQFGGTDARREAVQVLSRIGEDAVAPLLEALVGAGENDVRWYYAVALYRIGEPAVIPLVKTLQHHHDPDLRRYAGAALAEIGVAAVDPLISLLGVENDAELRGIAALGLIRIGEPPIESLSRAVEGGGSLAAAAGHVLWRMEGPGFRALADLSGIDLGLSDRVPPA